MSLKEKLRELFIPCTENGFKPNFLERIAMSVMLILILISFAAANLHALLWVASDWMVSTILPAVIVDLTNEERGEESLGVLRHNPVLDRAAQLKAEDMAKNGYFAHYSPTGVSPWFWFDEVSYNFVHAGENLAVHFTDSADVIDAWMKSPAHRANIMNGTFTEIGVGTAKGEYKGFPTVFVVQLFGTPAAAAPVEEPEVAGIATGGEESTPITLETVAVSEDESLAPEEQVAPATVAQVFPEAATEEPVVPEAVSGDLVLVEVSTATPDIAEEVVSEVPQEKDAEETVVLFSDLATTSRPGVPMILNTEQSGGTPQFANPETNLFERSATQPSIWLQVIYGMLAVVVALALIVSIVVEWRRQNPVQIAYGVGMLVIMGVLFHVHVALTSGVTIL